MDIKARGKEKLKHILPNWIFDCMTTLFIIL